MAKIKLTTEEIQTINYELMVNHLKKRIIVDWKLVEFPNGKGVPPMLYIVAQSRKIGTGVLDTNLFSVNRNYWNKQICSLTKI